ncbi:hypothetical protein [Dehalogenimonas etheniformans]|uniref:Uncharacterized protein n=1 Tax=Dehalogenimonas etheniformans TaxID=1536648 RepID=A0A2P5P7T0_9CHLR|nr:hypothetical protein [Dehalogenimonas etheniformans]PPD58363.1 hypothetical protein JP09_004455 [Dehalogenimonas etheniformans]QNT76937.1 hypothetical protein HX448_09755 [Dehalogenimonas etheniformans]
MSFLPTTNIGKWSVWLIVAFFVLVIIGRALSAMEQGGQEIAVTSGLPVVASISAMAAGVASFVTGMIGLIKFRERALTVFLSVIASGVLILMTISMFIVGSFQ